MLAGIVPCQAGYAQTSQADLVRPTGAADLNSNLARLASNPRDVTALIGAGEAALALDDPRAAAGFFARADAIESRNGRIKAGLGRVMLRLQNPDEALKLFDQAVRLGYPDISFLSDRGLARDMAGDQANAQRDYQAALTRTPDDPETLRRYAASLGISGQVDAAEKVLQPLLYKSDRAAWRYRAFILAMNNRQADAKKIADQTLPQQMVAGLTPYMQKMPYLTAAQKAAAVHFGHFPTTVGTSIVAITPTAPAPGIATIRPAAPVASAQLAARDAEKEAASTRRRERVPTQVAQAQPVRRSGAIAAPPPATPLSGREMAVANPVAPSRPVVQPASDAARPAVPTAQAQSGASQPSAQTPSLAQTVPAQAAPSTVAPSQRVPAQATPSQPGPSQATSSQPIPAQTAPSRMASRPSAPVQGPPAPGFDSLSGSATPSVAAMPAPVQSAEATPAPAPATTPAPNPEATRTLADIIRAIDVPDSERHSSVVPVDLAEIQARQTARRAEKQAAADKVKKAAAAKAKADADAKAKAEAAEKARLAANPSRNWLQVGTGANTGALSFTMKGLRKKYSVLAPQDAWTAGWGRTNRLVVGPFASFARAQALEKSLKADGADVFAWKSDAGEDVTRLK